MTDWELESSIGKILAFFGGGKREEPGSTRPGGLERDSGVT